MGNFRIVINATGPHGDERDKGHGETLEFSGPEHNPDAIAKRFVDELAARGSQVSEATLTHWPGQDSQIVDNLLTGKRLGSF